MKAVLDEVLEKIPETFNMAEIMAKAAEKTPYVVVAFQECERMNILTNEMRRSLKELNLGLKVRKTGVSWAPGMRLGTQAGRHGLAHYLICKTNQPPSPPGALALSIACHCPPFRPRAGVVGAPGQEREATQTVPRRRCWRGHLRHLQRPHAVSDCTSTRAHGAGGWVLRHLAEIRADRARD